MAFTRRPKNALLASFQKDKRLLGFGQGLRNLDWLEWGSAGTTKYLMGQGVEITDLETLTGFPPLMDHRLATLSHRIHGGILYRDDPSDIRDLAELGGIPFGLVFVDLYPVMQAIREGKPFEEIIRLIDIGGPTLLRAAAKAHTYGCIPVCDLDDCQMVLRLLETDSLTDDILTQLAQKVFATTAGYDDAIAKYLISLGPGRGSA